MAKHQIGKQVSKSTRISCHGLRKQAIMPSVQATRVGTTMREAMLNCKLSNHVDHIGEGGIVDSILMGAKRNAGNNLIGRGWSANLSARTVRQLTQEGVFA